MALIEPGHFRLSRAEGSHLVIHAVDATIVVVYMLVMIVLGVYLGRGQRDLKGYLLGGRDLPWYAILGSIVATETSTATFLSIPGITFASTGDMRFLQLTIGYIGGRVLVAVVLLPLFFRGEIYTAYELLNERFGGLSKQAASLLFLVTRNLGDGLRLFLAGIALEKVLDIPLPIAIVVIGIATIFYTFAGGMKAVIWSDCLQLLIYMVGGIVSLWMLSSSIPGGLGQLTEFSEMTGKSRVFDFRIVSVDGFSLWTEPYTLLAGLIGGAMLTLGTHGTDQMFVQRYLAARSQRDASVAVIASGFVVLLQFALFLLIGIALACFYDQVAPRSFDRNDEVFATFVVEHLPVGVVGLTLAAIFAAAMSTLSSSLNSSAGALVADFYLPWRSRKGKKDDSIHQLRVTRWVTIAYGCLQILIGIGASWISESVVQNALAIAGFTAGIMLGLFALGFLTRSAHQRGVLVGMLGGLVFLTYIKFGTSVAWTWLAVIGAFMTFALGLIASWILPRSDVNESDKLVSE